MTIADLIKYVDSLKQRSKLLEKKLLDVSSVKTTQRVIAQSQASNVVEEVIPTISVKELTSEYDANAKELRLAQQALEKANHTTEVKFDAKF